MSGTLIVFIGVVHTTLSLFTVFTPIFLITIVVQGLYDVSPPYLEVILLLLDLILGVLAYKNLDAIVTRLVRKLVYKDFDFLKLLF